MNLEQNNTPNPHKRSKKWFKRDLIKVIEHWHWFVAGAILALVLAFSIMERTPIYEVQGLVLTKKDNLALI